MTILYEFHSQSGDPELDSYIDNYLKNYVVMPIPAREAVVGDRIHIPRDGHVVIVEITSRHLVTGTEEDQKLMFFVEPINEPMDGNERKI